MKKKTIDLEELMLQLIGAWRRFQRIPGPPDRLQTREFRTTCEHIKEIEKAALKLSCPPATFYSDSIVAAYILYHFPLHLLEGLSILSEFQTMPKKVLEIASGAGPFAWASLLKGASDVTIIDKNPRALSLAGDIIGKAGFPLTIRNLTWPKDFLFSGAPYDLIIIGHALFELGSTKEERCRLIKACLDHLSQDGALLLVERPEKEHNLAFLEIRDHFATQNVPIFAPCFWQGECPQRKAHACCFAQRPFEKPFLMKELQRGAGIFLNSLKMSYMIFQGNTHHPQGAYRVVSPPLDERGKKRYFLCGASSFRALDLPAGTSEHYLRGSTLFFDEGSLLPKKIIPPEKPVKG
jgi:hypothetical protein